MGTQIDEKTRIPIAWVFIFIAFMITVMGGIVGGAVLYVTDIKTTVAVDSVRISSLDSRVTGLEGSFKEAILEIKKDMKELANYVNEKEIRRPAGSRDARHQ